MKKMLSCLISVIMVLSFTIPLYASDATEIDHTQIEDITALFFPYEMSSYQVEPGKTEVSIYEAFSEQELIDLVPETKRQREEMAAQGYEYVGSTVLVSTEKLDSRGLDSGITEKEIVEHYTKPTENLNDRSAGMYHWLDVAWSVAIGQWEYGWVASDVLGLKPSMFKPEWQKGESLTRTEQKTLHRYCYSKYSPVINAVRWYAETQSADVDIYVDLYTWDRNNNTVRKTGIWSKSVKSDHYKDYTWINNTVNTGAIHNMAVTVDSI